jgi:acetyl-CoA acetyltransferase
MSCAVDGARIVAAAEAPYTRHPAPGANTHGALADAVVRALAEAGLTAAQVDGLAVSSFSLAPDHAIDLAWRLGLSLRWLLEDTNGGASGIDMLGHASRALEAGDAEVIVIVAGDVQDAAQVANRQAQFNRATRDHLAPLHHGGPNALFAMLTQRQMRAEGLTAEDYGRVVIAQRRWASSNPGAVYRDPLSMEEYLSAPVVAEPLRRYDCVPPVAGADALVMAAPSVASEPPPIEVRAVVRSFNHDHQLGDGLETGLALTRDALWDAAGVGPQDVDLACIYDDYPAMVLAQLRDVGLMAGGDMPRFVRDVIARRRLAVNTSGGLLSAGQAGAAGGLHGLVEAVRQLQHRADGRQVPRARIAVTTGYGMVVYRYGAAAGAAVLERAA